MHCEATSEKMAMGHFCDGRASLAESQNTLRRWWRDRFGMRTTPVVENGSGLSRIERISQFQGAGT